MYATLANMMSRYRTEELIQLTDDAQQGVIDEARVDAALNDASDIIDGYLAGTYQLPLNPVPAVLAQHCCAIARYKLHANAAPEKVTAEYNAALDWLKSVAKGTVKLQVAGAEPASPSGPMVQTCETLIAGKRDQLRGF